MKLIYPPEYKKVVQSILRKAKRNKVLVKFEDSPTVDMQDGIGCAGYFNESPLILAIAMDVKFDTWMQTLLHESCHMDQYFDNETNEKLDRHYISFFEWLEGKAQFNNIQISAMVNSIIGHELDCEKRTVEKIRKFKLPIDIPLYIRKANTYFACYHIFKKRRKWYNKVYGRPEVNEKAPDYFMEDYTKIPRPLLVAIEKRMDQIDAGNP